MSFIPYPNVPALPGVPNIPRNPLGAISVVNTVIGNTIARILRPAANPMPRWRFLTEKLRDAIEPDSVLAVHYGNTSNVSDYPIEGGAFRSYNKVQTPFTVTFTVAKGGSDAERQNFLITCNAMTIVTQKFNVLTPDYTYLSMTCVGAQFAKTNRNGASLAVVDLTFREIRNAPAAQYSEPDGKTPPIPAAQSNSTNAASPVSGGQTQTKSPSGYAAGVYNLSGVQ